MNIKQKFWFNEVGVTVLNSLKSLLTAFTAWQFAMPLFCIHTCIVIECHRWLDAIGNIGPHCLLYTMSPFPWVVLFVLTEPTLPDEPQIFAVFFPIFLEDKTFDSPWRTDLLPHSHEIHSLVFWTTANKHRRIDTLDTLHSSNWLFSLPWKFTRSRNIFELLYAGVVWYKFSS